MVWSGGGGGGWGGGWWWTSQIGWTICPSIARVNCSCYSWAFVVQIFLLGQGFDNIRTKLYICYWDHGPVWFDLTQHGHQYGLNWHNMANLTNIHLKSTESRSEKQLLLFRKGNTRGVQFVRVTTELFSIFGHLGGTFTHQGWQFCLLIPNVTWLSYLRDILGPNLPVGPMFWWYQDKILLICCWGHDPLINLAQHGHQCGLIWLSIVNCLIPLRSGNWKYSQENIFPFQNDK